MKMTMRVRALDVAGELAQRLRHQARLQADVRVAHLALDLGLRHERRDRVDDDDVDRARAHQHVGDLERLLAGVRLRDQQVVDVDAELLGVVRVERVLGVDEGGDAAELLRLGDDLQRQRGLAGGFRAVDLDDAAARQAADAERDVERRASRSRPPRCRRWPRCSPSRMTEPLPNCFSIWLSAALSAFLRLLSSMLFVPPSLFRLFHNRPVSPSANVSTTLKLSSARSFMGGSVQAAVAQAETPAGHSAIGA